MTDATAYENRLFQVMSFTKEKGRKAKSCPLVIYLAERPDLLTKVSLTAIRILGRRHLQDSKNWVRKALSYGQLSRLKFISLMQKLLIEVRPSLEYRSILKGLGTTFQKALCTRVCREQLIQR